MRFRTWMSAAAVALICAAPAKAQQTLDSTKADPEHHKVEFENDEVRVVRYKTRARRAECATPPSGQRSGCPGWRQHREHNR